MAILLIKAALRRYIMTLGMVVIPFSSLRVLLLRLLGVKIGYGCYVGFNVSVDTNYPELILIGNNVTISHNVSVITHTGTPAKCFLGNKYNTKSTVKILDGAWIGARCIILPGVTIGPDCFIGAGSCVSKSTDSKSLWAGNPCKKIKNL